MQRLYNIKCGELFSNDKTGISVFIRLQEEFRRVARFGLGLALDMYPIMTCDSDEAPNLYQEKESGSASHLDVKPVWTANAACRRKMADLVIELVDQGLLQ